LVFQDNTGKNQDFFSTHVQFQDFSGAEKLKVKFHDFFRTSGNPEFTLQMCASSKNCEKIH